MMRIFEAINIFEVNMEKGNQKFRCGNDFLQNRFMKDITLISSSNKHLGPIYRNMDNEKIKY